MKAIDIVHIREPVSEGVREEITRYIHFREEILSEDGFRYIGGKDRSFDFAADCYGNSFHDFTEQSPEEPVSASELAEYFLIMMFKDTVALMTQNGSLREDQAESAVWMAMKGLLVTAAAMVRSFLAENKKEREGR